MRRKTAHAGDLVDVVGISHDGLILRADGTFVRILKVGAINPLVADDNAADCISASFSALASRLEPGQSLQFFVTADPVPLSDVIAESRSAVNDAAAAVEARGHPERARAMHRLSIAAEQSIATHSADIAAMALSYYVVCPYNPRSGALPELPRLRRGRGVRLSLRDAQRALAYVGEFADGVRKDLEALELSVHSLDGDEAALLIASRLSGSTLNQAQALDVVSSLAGFELVSAFAHGDSRLDPRADLAQSTIDFSQARSVRVGEDVEHVTFMSEIPESTWLGLPLQLMQIASPFVYSVFVRATSRVRERQRYRNRFRRIRGINVGRERKGRHVSIEAVQQEHEAEAVLADLTTTIGSGIFEVSSYIAVRGLGPEPDEELVRDSVARIRREATGSSDARFSDGLMAQRSLWPSTLPLGNDAAGRRRRFVSRNVGDLIPLVGSSCGSPSGVPIGYSTPGRTLERIDPFDPVHDNHLFLVTGRSGSGKTMFVNVLLSRWLARGAQGFIIDRAGHYDFLCSLIPGAAHVAIGPGERQYTVNPWDVDDAADVPGATVTFLVDLHAMLIGSHDAGTDTTGLTSLESNVLEGAIRSVYDRCAQTGERPTEALLQKRLFEEAERSAHAIYGDTALSLAYRLDKYVGDGTFSYLVDRPTNVPADAPLIVFDTRAIPEDLAGAVVSMITEHVYARIVSRRESFLSADVVGEGEWDGRSFLAIDEAWKQVARRATGQRFDESARRARHYALCILAVSQHLSDFDGPYGAAIRRNASVRLYFRQSSEDLAFAQASEDYSEAQIELMKGLRTAKREYATAYLDNGLRGSGVLTQSYGDLEYWLATSDPMGDEPLRRRALRDADGNAWGALKRLSDVNWHAAVIAASKRRPVGV